MKNKSAIFFAFLLAIGFTFNACGSKKVNISDKSKKFFGKKWTYDSEATRTAVLTKTGKTTGIKNLKDIKLKGDVKKGLDYLTHKTLYFAADKKGRGIGYLMSTGKGLLKSKVTGWMKWNAGETEFTLSPTKKNYKTKTYKLVEITANKMVILDKASKTNTPEIWKR
ncbi:hypothetical protein ACFL20_10820 [Spirochaetota bacterium]